MNNPREELKFIYDVQEFTQKCKYCDPYASPLKNPLSLSQLSAKKISKSLGSKENLSELVRTIKIPAVCVTSIKCHIESINSLYHQN